MFSLLILPPFVLSVFSRLSISRFDLLATSTIAHDIALVALVAFLVRRGGARLAVIGLRLRNTGREALVGIALFVPIAAVVAAIGALLQHEGLSGPGRLFYELVPGKTWQARGLALALVAVVAVAEETIFRGYFLTRLRTLTRSRIAAVMVSSLVFAIGHGYEGLSGVLAIGFFGLGLAAIAVWRGSLVAPITIHFLQDFLAIVLR